MAAAKKKKGKDATFGGPYNGKRKAR